MQAVCNSHYKFTAVWIQNPASASNFIAYLTSDLHQMLKTVGFLAAGLALFGDNAYISTNTLVTPFKYVTMPLHDDFNFF